MISTFKNKYGFGVKDSILLAVISAWVMCLYGAMPFLLIPSLGINLWATGFAQSVANGPWYSLYAYDIGFPKPAAVVMGLSNVWPTSLLIRLGLHPADAHSLIFACWLLVALFSAYKICCKFGATRRIALIGGATWMSMPIVWGHAGYSVLALGLGLLPFYFLATINLLWSETKNPNATFSKVVFYCSATIISIFMDGYSFMMFATGSSILFAYAIVSRPDTRRTLLQIALPVHFISFVLAYVLFSTYIGKANFTQHSIETFRAWGVDLSFIAIPTTPIHWIPTLLGLSLERLNATNFGDSSVWKTTFSLPTILSGITAWWLVKKNFNLATGILLVATFGFYMALGPSLKINSTRPSESIRAASMPADLAVMPTGNAWISENLPGFNIMRASYRWSALGVFALWMLIMASAGRTNARGRAMWGVILLALIVINLPPLKKRFAGSQLGHQLLHQIDTDPRLVPALRRYIRKDELVVFLPWGNDFLANYLAPRAKFRTFNIGGDKNFAEAQTQWPSEMLGLRGPINPTTSPGRSVNMLLGGSADVIVVPYFDMMLSAHTTPLNKLLNSWRQTSPAGVSRARRMQDQDVTGDKNLVEETPPAPSQNRNDPIQRREAISPFIQNMTDLPYIDVEGSEFFSTIRLKPKYVGSENQEALKTALLSNLRYPITLGYSDLSQSELMDRTFILAEGWHPLESHHVWSTDKSALTVPVPNDCTAKKCFAILKFNVFGASQDRPTTVNFSSNRWNSEITTTSDLGTVKEVSIPLTSSNGNQKINISIPNATSPQRLAGHADRRILGIGLLTIELGLE